MNKYISKKRKSQELILLMDKHGSDKLLARLGYCCSYLEFIADEPVEKQKMVGGITCHNRWCPLCAWRKAKADAVAISTVMNYIHQEHKKEFVFITLTTPNVTGANLKAEIAKMNQAFKNLVLRKEFLAANQGYARKLEVTYDSNKYITRDMYYGNAKRGIKPRADYYNRLGLGVGDINPNYDTYHPHFHVVMAVDKYYFKSKDYISQSELLDMWRSVMGNYAITQVDIRRARLDPGDNCVNEIAKYTAKDSDYLYSQSVFDVFYNALHGARLITYNGLFKTAIQLFKDGNLDNYKQVDPIEYFWLLVYQWNFKLYIADNGEVMALHDETVNDYCETKRHVLTDNEKIKYGKK